MLSSNEIIFDPENMKAVSPELAWHYRIIPSKVERDILELFIDEDLSEQTDIQNELEMALGKQVKLIPQSHDIIEKALSSFYLKKDAIDSPKAPLEISHKNFVSDLIRDARSLRSSDIHIETYEQKCRIRFRIDGKLIDRFRLNKHEYPALINKIKIMAGMDISEKRLPQDGRIFFNASDTKFDIRVSVLPTLYGEKIVLRILGGSAVQVNLDELGFSDVDLSRYKESIRKPNGIILISGPTGSGKTTTLYATLKLLNKDSSNIVTIEDPIEYTLEGINQVQVKDEIGLSFSGALRTFLRQDPDIIMVGEIRDAETASLAIRAALTGHLVLSTIHTNSAWGTISRLVDMGVPNFLLANTLNATLAQRLIRILCNHCKDKIPVQDSIWPQNFKNKHIVHEHYQAKGCKECFYTGYKGRMAIYEVIPVDVQIADSIINPHAGANEYFKSLGIKTLQESALEVLKQGNTSIEEIYPLLIDEQY
jgi:type IV pilus assembly protein PilB